MRKHSLQNFGIKNLLTLQLIIAPLFLSPFYVSPFVAHGFNGPERVTLDPLMELALVVVMPAIYVFTLSTLLQRSVSRRSLYRSIRTGVLLALLFGLLTRGPGEIPSLLHSISQSYSDSKSLLASARNNGLGGLWAKILIEVLAVHLRDRLFHAIFLTVWYTSIGSATGLLAFYLSKMWCDFETSRSQNQAVNGSRR